MRPVSEARRCTGCGAELAPADRSCPRCGKLVREPQPEAPPDRFTRTGAYNVFVAFLVIGMICGKLGRMMLDEAVGAEAGIGDRLGGAALGALRVGMVATTVVLVFDQLVPAERQPGFLNGSQLRPLFSLAAQKGFR